jgi:hypothetical protein
LDVLLGGLGLSKLQFFINNDKYFSAVFFLQFLVIKTLDPDPKPDPELLEMLDPDPDLINLDPQTG